ncbi:UDP-N-acetylglucosamine 2-epimerase (non-hydrolyzing) [Vitreoscilla massiliensis]|uniref:UDP-N-acetylglucosamine 2-epimerase (Non-hydrolyzing) n=1 Tax=Vitreoscilla massiliensis TaxID=1689272 RepID=A0ABY4E526_9NEIS|nr:UDP-N-acetylglucosamine 2-epimerase (non-hydrolyzing) [Vitreoscilla massiliensis]UOO90587.1 UDP-N-acetylglucosamine 2-epimerase (non-hydrolyzing) [Vitreoscilla massiliensis]
MKKIITVIGARPQFIKASVVSQALKQLSSIKEIIVHTGQHFDENMSNIFFNELNIPKPDYQLNINGKSHGKMTGEMLASIEDIILQEQPDALMVYGDTNSTLAGALAAAKLHVPVIHIEAGLRSFNMKMPEEINRILTDQISAILFCPTQTAIDNLQAEGFTDKEILIELSGDVMQDSAMYFKQFVKQPQIENLPANNFILATLHRAENTDNIQRLQQIVHALNTIHKTIAPVVLPLHPRTRNVLAKENIPLEVCVIEPVGYLEMIWLLDHCQLVLTDSGGVQKEAFFFKKPCVTMRDQTEWVELIEVGANQLAGADSKVIIDAVNNMLNRTISDPNELYGGGKASANIAQFISQHI